MNIEFYLEKLGFKKEEIQIYICLLVSRPLTILELSKKSGINRHKIYRILDDLLKKGIVEEVIEGKKMYLKACDLNKIEMYVKEKDDDAKFLKTHFQDLSNLFLKSDILNKEDTQIISYKGIEGIKQMIWNTLRAKNELYSYTYRDLVEIVGEDIINKWFEEAKLRKIIFKDIIGDNYITSVGKTRSQISKYKKENNILTRYAKPGLLDITYQTDIYNNVVAYYNWHDGEVFGVEIHNAKIAKMQKQIFQLVWDNAVEV